MNKNKNDLFLFACMKFRSGFSISKIFSDIHFQAASCAEVLAVEPGHRGTYKILFDSQSCSVLAVVS